MPLRPLREAAMVYPPVPRDEQIGWTMFLNNVRWRY